MTNDELRDYAQRCLDRTPDSKILREVYGPVCVKDLSLPPNAGIRVHIPTRTMYIDAVLRLPLPKEDK